MICLRPMRSDSLPKKTNNGVPSASAIGDQHVGELPGQVERLLQEGQRVELPGVPDHALPGRRAEQREQHELQVAPVAEALLDRIASRPARRT